MSVKDFNMPERPKWLGNCPHCNAVINPAFGRKVGDMCPFCQKLLQNRKAPPKRYGRSLF